MNIRINDIEVKIRTNPEIEDIERVRNLVKKTGFFRQDEIDIAAELVEERLAKGIKSGYRFLFADSPKGLAGYTCYGPVPCSLVSWDLYWIVTRNEWQGKGIGAFLLKLTEEKIQIQGGLNVVIETSSKELYNRTQHFYNNHGYHLKARLHDFYEAGDDKLIYMKRLS